MTVAAITQVLGGPKVFGRSRSQPISLSSLTRKGLPVSAVTELARSLAVDRKRLAAVLGITDRTLSRRLADGQRLTAQESDRTLRLARVVAQTVETLGSAEKASRWLQKPNIALGGVVPLDILDTDAGAQDVQDVLIRIEYGVFS